jgi:hypothetical protein
MGPKRRKMESKRQKMESKRRRMESKRQKMESKRRKMEPKREKMESKRQKMEPKFQKMGSIGQNISPKRRNAGSKRGTNRGVRVLRASAKEIAAVPEPPDWEGSKGPGTSASSKGSDGDAVSGNLRQS